MKVLVTGVAGQLGHDVMNELAKRGYEGIGSDIKEVYSGIEDESAVVTMPYVQMDITDEVSVRQVLTSISLMLSYTALHGQPLTLRKTKIKKALYMQSMQKEPKTLQKPAKI